MAMSMRMPRAIRMFMLMLVEHDLQTPPEGIGNSAEGLYAWDMIAALKTRDHGLGHLQPFRQLFLRLGCVRPKLQQPLRALCSQRLSVVQVTASRADRFGCRHCGTLAKLLTWVSTYAKLMSICADAGQTRGKPDRLALTWFRLDVGSWHVVARRNPVPIDAIGGTADEQSSSGIGRF
jgi:hypothetical protein